MKRVLVAVAGVFALLVAAALTLLWLLFRTPYLPQPKFGFSGDWRYFTVFGTEERQLPPAQNLWQNYVEWNQKTAEWARVYSALLGGANRQSAFLTYTNSGDTPMGAQKYTNVEFTYTDATNGTYLLSWTLRGEHDTRFLRFDTSHRRYQLQPFGNSNDYPPRLSIRAIEGIEPEHYRRHLRTTNAAP